MYGINIVIDASPAKDGKHPIRIRYTDHKRRSKNFATGARCLTENWDEANKKVLDGELGFNIANQKIKAKFSEVDAAVAELMTEGVDRPEKNAVVEKMRELKTKTKSVLGIFEEYLQEKEDFGKSTKVHLTVYKSLRKYEDFYGPLEKFKSMGQAFLTNWVKGLMNGHFTGRGNPLADQTIFTYIEKLEEFVKWSERRQLFEKRPSMNTWAAKKKLKPMPKKKPRVTKDEIEKLLAVKVEDAFEKKPADYLRARKRLAKRDVFPYMRIYKKEHLEEAERCYQDRITEYRKIRDAVVFMMRTGKRANEVIALRKEDIFFAQGMYFAKIAISKTKRENTFPIPPKAMEIVEKQNVDSGLIFKLETFSDPVSAMAKAIKVMAKKAGLNRDITVRTTYAGQVLEKTIPLWQAIGTHSGRVTFATELIEKNGNNPNIMRILQESLGHKDLRTTEGYVEKNMDLFLQKAASVNY